MPRPRRFLINASLVVLSLIVATALLETGARYAGLGYPVLYEPALAYGFRLQPDQKVARFGAATVTVNHAGLRATKEWDQAAARRILFVGDSITFGGSYIDDAQLFSEIACPAGAICGNAGVNAYGIENMARRIDAEAAVLKPTMIVVTLFYGDALRGSTSMDGMAVFSKPPLRPIQGLVELAAYCLDRARDALRFKAASLTQRAFDEAGATEAKRALKELFASLRASGAEALVVLSPRRPEVIGGRTQMGAYMLDMVNASGLPVLDMMPFMPRAEIDALYYDDTHLSGAGHAFYGKIIGAKIAGN